METVKQYLKHPRLWINALLGRPTHIEIPKETSEQNQSAKPASTQETTGKIYEEDPVMHDVEKVKGIFEKLTSKAKSKLAPTVAKSIEDSSEVVSASKAFAKTDKFKKIIPIIIFVLILLVLGAVAFSFINRMGKKENSPTAINDPSPTPIEFIPTEPSIYANDAEVLQLEENIVTLDREIAGTALRESTLNPPSLDFNIKF